MHFCYIFRNNQCSIYCHTMCPLLPEHRSYRYRSGLQPFLTGTVRYYIHAQDRCPPPSVRQEPLYTLPDVSGYQYLSGAIKYSSGTQWSGGGAEAGLTRRVGLEPRTTSAVEPLYHQLRRWQPVSDRNGQLLTNHLTPAPEPVGSNHRMTQDRRGSR
jgi:hypothetical protein